MLTKLILTKLMLTKLMLTKLMLTTKVVDQVVAGDGVGWLKLSRLRKLMEVVFVRIIMIIVTIIMSVLIIKYKSFDQDENYRNMILPKLNRSLDCAGSPDDHIQDVVRQCESDADICTS